MQAQPFSPPRPGALALARKAAGALAAGLALCLAGPAWAEKADREKPVNIEADRMFYDDLRQLNIFEGNVTLTQGTLVIRADKLSVKQDPEGFQRGIAEKGAGGLAYFRQKRDNVEEYIEGWGERIEYDAKTEKADLITRARVLRGRDSVTGNKINYDGRTEFYTVVGGGKEDGDGRVRAVIQPKTGVVAPEAAKDPLGLKPSGGVAKPPQEFLEPPKR